MYDNTGMSGRGRINPYFAIFIVTVFASLATVVIVDMATTNVISAATSGSEATYAALQESILKSRL